MQKPDDLHEQPDDLHEPPDDLHGQPDDLHEQLDDLHEQSGKGNDPNKRLGGQPHPVVTQPHERGIIQNLMTYCKKVNSVENAKQCRTRYY